MPMFLSSRLGGQLHIVPDTAGIERQDWKRLSDQNVLLKPFLDLLPDVEIRRDIVKEILQCSDGA
jgi:hypothetical protein